MSIEFAPATSWPPSEKAPGLQPDEHLVRYIFGCQIHGLGHAWHVVSYPFFAEKKKRKKNTCGKLGFPIFWYETTIGISHQISFPVFDGINWHFPFDQVMKIHAFHGHFVPEICKIWTQKQPLEGMLKPGNSGSPGIATLAIQ